MDLPDEMRVMQLEQQLKQLRQSIEAVERKLPRGAPDGSVKVDGGMVSTAASASGQQGGGSGSGSQNTRDVWLCTDAVPELVTFHVQ